MSLPVAILAGGLATRLRPLTERIPKSLVEVAGQPFAVHQLELLKRHGFNQVVFCVGYLGEMVQEELGDGGRWGMQVGYVSDGDKLLGTGGALRKALPLLGEAFLVLYGDSYLDCDFRGIEAAFLRSGKLGLMTVFRNANTWGQSNVLFRNGQILCYNKHHPKPEMQHIDYGVEVLKAEVFEKYLPGARLDLSTVLEDLVGRGELAAVEIAQRFYEIGSPDGLRETHDYLKSRKSTGVLGETDHVVALAGARKSGACYFRPSQSTIAGEEQLEQVYQLDNGRERMELERYFEFLTPDDIRIKGTRVGIETVLDDYLGGASPEEIAVRYRTLTLEQIYATITYYLSRQREIDAYLERWRAYSEAAWQHQQLNPSPATRRLRELKAGRLSVLGATAA